MLCVKAGKVVAVLGGEGCVVGEWDRRKFVLCIFKVQYMWCIYSMKILFIYVEQDRHKDVTLKGYFGFSEK